MRATPKALPAKAFALFTLLFLAIGMVSYPGGTPFDATTRSYSLTQNTLSDLGMLERYGGGVLVISHLWFGFAMLAAAAATVMFLHNVTKSKAARQCGIAAAVCFAFIPFIPSDTILWMHNIFFFGCVILSSVGLWFAYAKEKQRALLLLALILSAYTALILYLPAAATNPHIRTIHSLAQKLVVFTIFGIIAALPATFKKR